MPLSNPFSPSFGISPPVLAGRRDVLHSFDSVFDNIRSPSYATLLWGLRGMGKTVLLNAVEDRARSQGWAVVSSSSVNGTGLLAQITSKVSSLLAEWRAEHEPAPRRTVSGVSIMGTGIQTERVEPPDSIQRSTPDLEAVLGTTGDLLAESGVGLLITVDEMHVSDIDEIRLFGNVFQLVSRRAERPVAFVGAALPELEGRLLSGDESTFLQRCVRHEIGNLRPSETATALREPIEEAGGRIEDEALAVAVEVSLGQPYLVQLIGSHVWDDAGDLVRGVTVEEVKQAANNASELFGNHVHGPVWRRLSSLDKRFLAAMLDDHASSVLSDVGERWGHSARSLGTYRQRLMQSGLINSVGHGQVMFADHTVRRFVKAQATKEGFTT